MTKKKKIIIGVSGGVTFLIIAVLLGLIFTGLYVGWGPFTFMQFDKQEKAIVAKYDSSKRQNEIVFYGASNFRLWTEMDGDLSEYKVQNHGFGGQPTKTLWQERISFYIRTIRKSYSFRQDLTTMFR